MSLSRKQNKLFEVYVAKRSLLGVNPRDFDIQDNSKRARLERLGLTSLRYKLILDAGSGPGTYGLLLAQKKNEVVGVDISYDAVKMAKKRAFIKGVDQLFHVVVADLENLPLRDGIFDVCFSGWVLHHFTSLEVIKELARVLKSGARIALAEPNEASYIFRITRYAEEIFSSLLSEVGLHTQNVTPHSYEDYCRSLRKYGFNIISVSSCYTMEPVILPRNISFSKRLFLLFSLFLRGLFAYFITKLSSPPINGTDLLIIATLKHKSCELR